ncbi:hypothetical protein BMS_1776 [Halobacteriovorax marinus SJ]|uniref:VOC domain-containing protein n=1 Tax=Halobacteriovorax marinus (strain ATCC BAA-682 / DSM 15412 / SJ) TaxID=862908 RepID=E1X1U1_HALMS|nr:hypothetical protein [Halobacteriovorax marinus]CBW26601.1 hypothetical protein BMS_1776 [Halobacteriovorax marinus SJ]
MSLRIGQIALHSKDNKTLASFLSELLDMEISFSGEAVRLTSEEFSLVIIEDPDMSPKSSMVIDFFTDSFEELQGLIQKIEFIKYRYRITFVTDEGKVLEEVKIHNVGHLHYFFLSDTDGRRWKFSYRENKTPVVNPFVK